MNLSRAYWDRVSATKTFTHPLRSPFDELGLPSTARILDVGCGYGRVAASLRERGHTNVVGVDLSIGMLRRAPSTFRHVQGTSLDLPFAEASFDLALLFSVLTTVPQDREQERLVAEVERVLVPGGFVYVSDLRLQEDERHRKRYESGRSQDPAAVGMFEHEGEGTWFRHHAQAWLEHLFARFAWVSFEPFVVCTMNGHYARAFQLMGRRS
ncbi:MAG: class I SAM-dependent methyltransferase [Planctomycetes bacterium]|nr:class I SAM-dependent methyltransferase [Planctomycetota bacterium]